MEHYENLSTDSIDGEVWVNTNYDNYKVSSFGRVKSMCRKGVHKCRNNDVVLKQYINIQGYPTISLRKNGKSKSYTVHRVVALAFIPNPENKPTVNHKFGVKTDNRVSQLEWATYSEQNLHRYKVLNNPSPPGLLGRTGSLHHLSKRVLCITNGKEYGSAREAARELKLQQTNVSNVCRGGYKQTGGYIFKYF